MIGLNWPEVRVHLVGAVIPGSEMLFGLHQHSRGLQRYGWSQERSARRQLGSHHENRGTALGGFVSSQEPSQPRVSAATAVSWTSSCRNWFVKSLWSAGPGPLDPACRLRSNR